MKKNELKKLIKPLVKECIHEVLIEEGLLSNVVAEVAQGLQGNLMTEVRHPPVDQRARQPPAEQRQMKRTADDSRAKLKEHRRKLMGALNKDAYGGIDLFEGTDPMQHSEPSAGHPDLGDPGDAGVDLSSILGNASEIWQSIK